MSLPYWCAKNDRIELGKKLAIARAKKRMLAGVDAETVAWRSKDDRRGLVLRQGCTYSANGNTEWLVRHSVSGRSDQFDLVANGSVVKTAGARRLPARFRP